MTIKEFQIIIKQSHMRECNIIFINETTHNEYDYYDMYDGLIDYTSKNIERISSRVISSMSDSENRCSIESQIVIYFD